ncbi:MAG: endolytic transglycosylase MltG [Clostridia bacterium]|nr:endolytic transglycosylase MltG [Clostridia bacterium]
MSDYRNIFSNDGERYDKPNQPKRRTFNDKADAPLTPEEINGGKVGSAPTPPSADDFVIGGGFKISDDYESRIRSRKEKAREMGRQEPVSERDVHMGKLSKQNARNKRKNKKHGPLYTLLWAIGIILISVLAAWMLILGANDLLGLVGDKDCDVQIEKGMNTKQIASVLKEEGVIDYPLLFRLYVKFKGQDSSLKYGGFALNGSMGYDGIIEQLQKSNERKTVKVTIPDGATVQGIRKLLEENNVCTADNFNYVLKHLERYDFKYDFVKRIPVDNVYYSLEGYLYPDTYEFFTMVKNEDGTINYGESNAVHAINRMMGNLDAKIQEKCPDYKDKIKSLKRYGIEDLHDVLSMASIVQMECSGFDAEMPKVASVFLNRLVWENEPHYLGSTPTFYYPDNRYNTNNYALYDENETLISEAGYEGLPPGPQCSMTISAILAVLEPDKDTLGESYYFVTDKNHKFYYNRTLSQHESTIARLRKQGLWA